MIPRNAATLWPGWGVFVISAGFSSVRTAISWLSADAITQAIWPEFSGVKLNPAAWTAVKAADAVYRELEPRLWK